MASRRVKRSTTNSRWEQPEAQRHSIGVPDPSQMERGQVEALQCKGTKLDI